MAGRTTSLRRTSSLVSRKRTADKDPEFQPLSKRGQGADMLKAVKKSDEVAFRGVTHHCRTNRFEVRYKHGASATAGGEMGWRHAHARALPAAPARGDGPRLTPWHDPPWPQAHIWEGGKQLYLGGYDSAELAAVAFDIAALRYRGRDVQTNFHISFYEPFLANLTKVGRTPHALGGREACCPPPAAPTADRRTHADRRSPLRRLQYNPEEITAGLRKHSKGSLVQTSLFRGVTRHQKGRWEARIGQASGRRYAYLGLHDTELQAAQAYDRAAIGQKGVEAATNFHMAEYLDALSESRRACSALPACQPAPCAHTSFHTTPQAPTLADAPPPPLSLLRADVSQVQQALRLGILAESDLQCSSSGTQHELPSLSEEAELPEPAGCVPCKQPCELLPAEACEPAPGATPRRSSTTSVEDPLAEMLYGCIAADKDGGVMSPQTVLPRGCASPKRPNGGMPTPAGAHDTGRTAAAMLRDAEALEGAASMDRESDAFWESVARELFG
jgi:hypothetical protein